MGPYRIWSIIICLMLYVILLLPFVQGLDSHQSLDAFVRDQAYTSLARPRTGILYNISLPANFSGMEVSMVRLRSASFWERGANFSFFYIPPRIIPMPFTKRLDIVYQNLGNLSSQYYNVPNYSFITPVVGFMTYDSKNISTRGDAMLNLSIMGDPILVRFPQISATENENVKMKCVRFGTDGSLKFINMTMTNSCIAWGQGHFSIVIPSSPNNNNNNNNKKKEKVLKWWIIGFGVGILGVVLLGLAGILIYKLIKKKRIGKMERQAERSEALDTIWVGRSRMPSAKGMRTQPVLESNYVP